MTSIHIRDAILSIPKHLRSPEQIYLEVQDNAGGGKNLSRRLVGEGATIVGRKAVRHTTPVNIVAVPNFLVHTFNWDSTDNLGRVSLSHPTIIVKQPQVHNTCKQHSQWEAVLHPAGMGADRGGLRPLGDAELQLFSQLVEYAGGVAHTDRAHRISGLTFVGVRIPAGKTKIVAQFNPLRVLRRMPETSVRKPKSAHTNQPAKPW